MEEEVRKRAIFRYIIGEPPKAVYDDLNRSKRWFFKWLKRYQTRLAKRIGTGINPGPRCEGRPKPARTKER